uniref:Retrovirus-related Pol polyprotein from transposon TNT 1-94 n=1 Tax=Cajanus cajan TaxID=3821 RepID=A0A151U1S8_CAJCA|nr:hypothetical protein KK1_005894 [Cajanus cajan]
MKIFIEAIDLNIWDGVENGPFIPTIKVGNEIKLLPNDQWSEDDKRKVQYNLKAKNIITPALGTDEYFRISNYRNKKEMWDTLQVTHEGTNDVKRSRINALTHEYKSIIRTQGKTWDSVKQTWYIDSGCSKHMMGDASKFIDITPKKKGHVTYGDNNKGKILGIGKIGTNLLTSIENVLLVDALKHSLLNVSQLCDKGFLVTFDSQNCFIEFKYDKNIKFVGYRVNNVYKINLEKTSNYTQCLISKEDESWLWHKRIAHINMEHLNKTSSTCYTINRALIRPILKKTPYELFNGRKPNISHLHIFGCKCFVLNNGKDNLGKFDAKLDGGIFLGYSLNIKSYRVYNKRTMTIEESIHVVFYETNLVCPRKNIIDDIVESFEDTHFHEQTQKDREDKGREDSIIQENQTNMTPQRELRISRNHPLENIIGDISKGVTTRHSLKDACNNMVFVPEIKVKNIYEALNDEHWINSMQEKLNQFERNQVWELVDRPSNHPIIGTKWIFRNKLDEHGIVIRNKARLVAKGYNQEEDIDYA